MALSPAKDACSEAFSASSAHTLYCVACSPLINQVAAIRHPVAFAPSAVTRRLDS